MATSYPTSKQTLTNPTATTDTSAVSHANQHATINDTVAALEDTVGYSADTSSSVLGKLSGITGTDIAVGKSATQTITNKTISGASNTFSNIPMSALTLPREERIVLGNIQAGGSPGASFVTLDQSRETIDFSKYNLSSATNAILSITSNNGTAAQTSTYQLYNVTDSTVITGTSVTQTSTSARNAQIIFSPANLPTTSKEIAIQWKVTSGAVAIWNITIIIQY